jgi:outer membrane protein OmpA-like peptidoglycan-associated protein
MKLPNLTQDERNKFQNGVIQVNGKAMNRTALGIVDAYFTLYPNTTFAELKEVFPDNINPSGPKQVKTIFKPYTDRDFGVVHSLEEIKTEFAKAGLPYENSFFLEKNEMFETSDGITVIVNKLWESKDTSTGEVDLENLAKQALKFGIVVNKFEAKTPFTKSSYSLDFIQPDLYEKICGKTKIIEREVIREKTIEKKVIPFYVWILLALALIPIILWMAGYFNPKPISKEIIRTDTLVQVKVDTIVQVKVDTIFSKEIEDIETRFNAVQFIVGKAEIPEDAKYALYDLAKVIQNRPDLKLSVEGHTSNEGDSNFNKQLSLKRAKAVVNFMIGRGIDSSRLTFEGKGSSSPIDINNRDINRRTEFIIINQ